jgi:hypothetical protein
MVWQLLTLAIRSFVRVAARRASNMQNMMRFKDAYGFFNIFFDIKDGEVVNVTMRDGCGDVTPNDPQGLEEVKNILAAEYAATAIEMAMIYKSGMMPLKV